MGTMVVLRTVPATYITFRYATPHISLHKIVPFETIEREKARVQKLKIYRTEIQVLS